jgi:4a-hydroxytetrahydrobiopterin dehydratase
MASRLTDRERAEALALLPLWRASEDGGAITRTFIFADFSEAFGFMTRAALAAEALDHHPEWANSYKTVKVTLTTHDAGGLTSLDMKLAQIMDSLVTGSHATPPGEA